MDMEIIYNGSWIEDFSSQSMAAAERYARQRYKDTGKKMIVRQLHSDDDGTIRTRTVYKGDPNGQDT